MKKYIAKRLLHALLIMMAISFITFLLMHISPGDAAQKKLAAQGEAVSPEVLQAVREEMGLNRSFPEQYLRWLGGVLRGDLGTSFQDDRSVSRLLVSGLGNTALLSLGSLLLSLIVALPLSMLCAVRKDGPLDYGLRLFSFVGNSMPNFLISVLLMYFLCVKFRLLPVIAERSLQGLILPCLALAVPMCSRFLRQFRAHFLEEMSREYVIGARARGVRSRYILFSNVLHNSSISLLTIVALSVGSLLGGSVVIETIFRWPGLGKLAMDAISARDYPVVQGFVLLTSAIYALINLLTDICYQWIDPRVRDI